MKKLSVLTIIALLVSMPAFAQDSSTSTIVGTADADGRFTTLITALEAAGLSETLEGEGPFTVFAPTDEAFAALPDGTVEGLLADPEALRNVLLYHVVPGEVPAEQVLGSGNVETVSGRQLDITVDGSSVRVNDANVVATDVRASNGIIHVIDSVLIPPSE